jgi:hypothetical protein
MKRNDHITTFVAKDVKGNTLLRSTNLQDAFDLCNTNDFKGVIQVETAILVEDEYVYFDPKILKEY